MNESREHHAALALGGTDATILAAAREEFIRYGIRRASVSEIARHAGVSRVTVHRRFSGKGQLLRAVIMADVAHFQETIDEVWYGPGPVAERVTEAITLAVALLRGHPLLTTLMASEPETLALQFTFRGGTEFEMVCALLTSRLDELVESGQVPPIDTHLLAETTIRLCYTIILIPYGDVPGQTGEQIRAFAEAVLIPLLHLH